MSIFHMCTYVFIRWGQIFDQCIVSLCWVENLVIQENVGRNHKPVVNVAKQLRGSVHLLPDRNQHLTDYLLVVMFEKDWWKTKEIQQNTHSRYIRLCLPFERLRNRLDRWSHLDWLLYNQSFHSMLHVWFLSISNLIVDQVENRKLYHIVATFEQTTITVR